MYLHGVGRHTEHDLKVTLEDLTRQAWCALMANETSGILVAPASAPKLISWI
jgi:hypothetical protein